MPADSARRPPHSDAGIKGVLLLPLIYRTLQSLVGAERTRTFIAREHIVAGPGDSVLDLGCGAGDILPHLPETVRYTGIDFNGAYVESAQSRFGSRARFLVGDVTELDRDSLQGPFDRVLLISLLHHLEDADAERLLDGIGSLLAPGGYVVTFDSVLLEHQSRVARFLIDRDRGQRVRTPEGYRALLLRSFGQVDDEVRHDLLRIPYTHFIARASRPLV